MKREIKGFPNHTSRGVGWWCKTTKCIKAKRVYIRRLNEASIEENISIPPRVSSLLVVLFFVVEGWNYIIGSEIPLDLSSELCISVPVESFHLESNIQVGLLQC